MAHFPSVSSAQIVGTGDSINLSSGASSVMFLPVTVDGYKPARVRIALSAGAAHVRLGLTASSTTAITTDTIVTAYESLVLPTFGNNCLAGRTVTKGSTDGVLQVSPLEDGALVSSSTPSGS